jgi:hypothetical protein
MSFDVVLQPVESVCSMEKGEIHSAANRPDLDSPDRRSVTNLRELGARAFSRFRYLRRDNGDIVQERTD